MWLQLNLPKAQALAPIAGLGDGSFVIRSSESRPECLVLSYKCRGQIIYELIRYFGGGSVGYALECAPERRFASLEELVAYYEVPRPELKFPLVSSSVYGTSGESDFGSRHTSVASRRSADSVSSRGTLQREGSRQALSRGNSQATLKRESSRGKLTRGSSRSSGMVSEESSGSATIDRRAQMQRKQSSKSVLTSGARPSVAVIRTSGERVDQRAAMSAWFCMNMSKEEVIARIPRDRQGAFLVRRASDAGFCTISYNNRGKIEHAHVEDTPSGLHVFKSQVCM